MQQVAADLEHFFTAVDMAFAAVQRDFTSEVTCEKGCDDCCHAVFDLSWVEAVNLRQHLGGLDRQVRSEIEIAATESSAAFVKLRQIGDDLAKARIRCPLLAADGSCIAYQARPVNCRTYGIPTVINGTGHVCGLSNFDPGSSYPTVNLENLQQVLYEFSLKLADKKKAAGRWSIAAVILG